jgi:hypothetical protein
MKKVKAKCMDGKIRIRTILKLGTGFRQKIVRIGNKGHRVFYYVK